MYSNNLEPSPVGQGTHALRFSQRVRARHEREAVVRAAVQATAAVKVTAITQVEAETTVLAHIPTATVIGTEPQTQQTPPPPTSGRSSKMTTKAKTAPVVTDIPNSGDIACRRVSEAPSKATIKASVGSPVKPKVKTQSRATAHNPVHPPHIHTPVNKGKGRTKSASPPSSIASASGSASTTATESSIQTTIGTIESEYIVTRSRRNQALALTARQYPSTIGDEIATVAAPVINMTTTTSDTLIVAVVPAVAVPAVLLAAVTNAYTAASGVTEVTDDISTTTLQLAVAECTIDSVSSHHDRSASLEKTADLNSESQSPLTTNMTDDSIDSHVQRSTPPSLSTQQQASQALNLFASGHPSPDLCESPPGEDLQKLLGTRCGHQNLDLGVLADNDNEMREQGSSHCSPIIIADDEEARFESHSPREPDTKKKPENNSLFLSDQRVFPQTPSRSQELSHGRPLKRKSESDVDDFEHSEGSSLKSCRVGRAQRVKAEGSPVWDEAPEISWEAMRQHGSPRFKHMAPNGIQMNEWIQQVTNHLLVDHITSAGPSANPLSHVIYWMPRIPPMDGTEQRTWGGHFQYWVIPVWPVTAPTDGPIVTADRVPRRPATVPQSKPESFVYHLRATDVAHWLHISTQDLVAFLSLAHPRELEALNLYLNFRRELMLYIPFMPSVIQWAKNKIPLGPGDHMYELFAKIKALDDERQRTLTWQLHSSVLERRSNEAVRNDAVPFIAIFPLNAPYPYDRVQYRKDFHHEVMAWQGFRRRQSAVKDFYEDPLRWFIAKDRPFENEQSAILDMAKSLWEDEHELAKEEVERQWYKTGGEMEKDENLAAGRDMRYIPGGPFMSAHEKIEELGAGGKERDLMKITAEEFVFEWRRDLDRMLRNHRHEAPAYILEADLQIMRSRTPDLSQINPIEILQGPIPARKANSLHRLVMDHMANPDDKINWDPEGPSEQLPIWTGAQEQLSYPSSPWPLQQRSPPTLSPQYVQAAVRQPYSPPQPQWQSEHEVQRQLELQQQFECQQQVELQHLLRLLFEQPDQCQQDQQIGQQQLQQPQFLSQQSQAQFPQSQQQQFPQILLPQLQQWQPPQNQLPLMQQQQPPQIQFQLPEIQISPIQQLPYHSQMQFQLPDVQLSATQQQQQQHQQLPSIDVPETQFLPTPLQAQFPEHQQQLVFIQPPQMQPHFQPQEQGQGQEQEQQPHSPPPSDFQGYEQLPPLFPSFDGGSEDFDYFFN